MFFTPSTAFQQKIVKIGPSSNESLEYKDIEIVKFESGPCCYHSGVSYTYLNQCVKHSWPKLKIVLIKKWEGNSTTSNFFMLSQNSWMVVLCLFCFWKTLVYFTKGFLFSLLQLLTLCTKLLLSEGRKNGFLPNSFLVFALSKPEYLQVCI